MASTTDFIVQKDFSGGEVSTRVLMRTDTDIVQKSMLQMENFMPTLQGSAERTPGTRFVEELLDDEARIIPYLSPTNERSLVKITEGAISFIPDITSRFEPGFIVDPGGTGIVTVRRQIVENSLIGLGPEPWGMSPPEAPSADDGEDLGLAWQGGFIRGNARVYRDPSDPATLTITNEATIPKDTAVVTVDFRIIYRGNHDPEADFTCFLKLGKTAGAGDIMNIDFKDIAAGDGVVGSVAELTKDFTANLLADDTVYITVEWTAISTEQNVNSTPRFALDRFQVFANDEADLGDGTIVGAPPYTKAQLKDLHFVQSPLMPAVAGGISKELVIVHPSHPPYRLYYDPDNLRYQFDAIVFVNQPNTWVAGNYPATCGTFVSRLVLAGSQGRPDPGDPASGDTETVWCTDVGKWDTFTDDVNPADAIEFTTTYRSPIQWVYGQKDLLIGALEFEYIASADGIFQPADLGVSMHSTHGSANVQPAGFGDTVFFPAEGGKKVRSMGKSLDIEGWLAPDHTLLNPEICESGIKRMIRLRNPHQILVVLLNNGEIALLHQDRYAGISGWSRINMNAQVQDIAVMSDDKGLDILFCTVIRNIDGVKKLYLEAFDSWILNSDQWRYMLSTKLYDFAGEQNFADGLEHLEGQVVQVIIDHTYIGTHLVTAGRVDFVDQSGNAITASSAQIGIPMSCVMRTLPLTGRDPSSKKRYSRLSIRIRSSIIPMIGAQSEGKARAFTVLERYPTRSTWTNLDESSDPWLLRDVTIGQQGWSSGQTVWISENIPQRVEVLAIFGKLTSNSA